MKMQNTNSRKVVTKITFLATLLIMTACKEPVQHATVPQIRITLPDTDIHTITMTGNKEALKENTGIEFILNETNPPLGPSPSLNTCLFLLVPFSYVLGNSFTTGR